MKSSLLESERNSHGPEARVTNGVVGLGIISFLCGAGFTLPFLVNCGASLALFLAGLFMLTTLLPPLALMRQRMAHHLTIAACVLDGIAGIWLISVSQPQVSLIQWLACYAVLIAYATSLTGMVVTLARAGIAPLAASAITVVLSIAWLTWPVWLTPHLTASSADSVVAALVRFHPLFAINGTLMHLGAWSHWPIAYRELTTLGQDIPYTFPSIWPAALTHGAMGAVLLAVSCSRRACSPP